MIHSFSVENFYSIRERLEIDFRSYDASSLDDWAVKSASGAQISLALGFFGANGSGKTNFLKALTFCLCFMKNSFSESFTFDQSWFFQQEISKFSLIYENGKGEIFEYHLYLLLGEVIEERLYSQTEKKDIFARKWDKEKQKDIYSCDDSLKIIPFQSAKRTASFISYSRQFNIEAIDIPQDFNSNIHMGGRRNYLEYQNIFLHHLHNNRDLLKEIEKELDHLDTGLLKINFKEIKTSTELSNFAKVEQSQLQVTGSHKIGEEEYDIPYHLESGGTRVAIFYLAHIVQIFQTGGIAIIDEIEAELHPQLVEYLVKLFKDPQKNKKNAQLIFTSHMHMFLNELEAERVYLVEKNEGASEAYRLDEFEDLEEGDDLRRKYLAGAFGAIPNLGG